MLHRRFKFTPQPFPYTIVAILLIYILFDVVAGELVTLFGSFGEVTPRQCAERRQRARSQPPITQERMLVMPSMITVLAGVTTKSVAFQVGTLEIPDQPPHKAFLPLIRR